MTSICPLHTQTNDVCTRIRALWDEEYYEKFSTPPAQPRLLESEIRAGFNETNAIDRRKHFNNLRGYFLEKVYACAEGVTKIALTKEGRSKYGGCDHLHHAADGTLESLSEHKNREDTCKQSDLLRTVERQLRAAIKLGVKYAFVVHDEVKTGASRNVPLHKISQLATVQNIDGYDPDNHRWMSGDEAYVFYFGKTDAPPIKAFVLSLYDTLQPCMAKTTPNEVEQLREEVARLRTVLQRVDLRDA